MADGTTTWDGLFWLAASRSAGGTGLDVPTFAALLKAHARVESSFDPGAIGPEQPTISRGLMQVTEATARSLGYAGPLGDDGSRTGGMYEPAVSIDLAAKLVRQNLQDADGAINTAIAAYNEGIRRARDDARSGRPWRTTDPRYVEKVRAALDDYLPFFSGQADGGASLLARGAL